MNDHDGRHGAASDPASAPPGERERAVREVFERIAAVAAQRAAAQRAALPIFQPRRDAPPPTQQGATLRSPPAWVAGPAGAESSPAPVQSHAPPASFRRALPRSPAFLAATTPLDPSLEAVAKAALPFVPAPAAQPPPPPRRGAPRTVQSRVVGLGETMACDADAIEKGRAAIPSPVPLPPLTLRQFASLCAELAFQPAELALQPERRRAILALYLVPDEAVFTALDAYWRRVRAAWPEARTAFADDFASHLAWLHAHAV